MAGPSFFHQSINQHKPTQVLTMQRNLSMMAAINPPAMLDEALLERCSNAKQALAVSMGLARTNASDASLADTLGVMPCVWSRIKNQPKNRPANLPLDSLAQLAEALGNRGLLQWLAMQQGCRLVPIAETRAQRLRRELAELESAEHPHEHTRQSYPFVERRSAVA